MGTLHKFVLLTIIMPVCGFNNVVEVFNAFSSKPGLITSKQITKALTECVRSWKTSGSQIDVDLAFTKLTRKTVKKNKNRHQLFKVDDVIPVKGYLPITEANIDLFIAELGKRGKIASELIYSSLLACTPKKVAAENLAAKMKKQQGNTSSQMSNMAYAYLHADRSGYGEQREGRKEQTESKYKHVGSYKGNEDYKKTFES